MPISFDGFRVMADIFLKAGRLQLTASCACLKWREFVTGLSTACMHICKDCWRYAACTCVLIRGRDMHVAHCLTLHAALLIVLGQYACVPGTATIEYREVRS